MFIGQFRAGVLGLPPLAEADRANAENRGGLIEQPAQIVAALRGLVAEELLARGAAGRPRRGRGPDDAGHDDAGD